MNEKQSPETRPDAPPIAGGEDPGTCDCLVVDPCGCFVDPCACFRTDVRGCYSDCGCPDRPGEVLRHPLL